MGRGHDLMAQALSPLAEPAGNERHLLSKHHRSTIKVAAGIVMKMAFGRIRDFLLPGAAERDEQFRQGILGASRAGLPALGAVEMIAALLLYTRPGQAAALGVLGAATWAAARTPLSRKIGRTLALISAALALIVVAFGAGNFTEAAAMLILSGTIVSVPLLPGQAVLIGAIPAVLYPWLEPGHEVFLVTLTVLSTIISGVLYRRRAAAHREHQEALRIAEALSGAQLRAQLAESAMAIGKLAAAITHDINTPLGSLTSSRAAY
jgi:signal transduction histidine kinase